MTEHDGDGSEGLTDLDIVMVVVNHGVGGKLW